MFLRRALNFASVPGGQVSTNLS